MEQRYEFRNRLNQTQKKLDFTKSELLSNEITLENGVAFVGFTSCVVENAKRDLEEYLSVGYGISKTAKAVEIKLAVSPDISEEVRSYKGREISVTEQGIVITAYDERGLAQAIYDLEDKMTDRQAPYLQTGVTKQKPRFAPRMAHASYDFDVFPDGYMQNLAREGIDVLIVYAAGVNQSPVGYMDFDDIIARAKKYGMDVYAYCFVNNFHHPDEENAKQIFYDIYAPIFKAHDFKGMVFVGESVEFPSRDPRVTAQHYYEKPADNIPSGKPSPGWWPCEDYPKWLNLVKDSIRSVKPETDIVFWTYNWGYAPKEDRIKLLNALPTDISLLVTFEMFERYDVMGVTEMVCDYSLAFEGPGEYFLSEAEVAKKRGIRLYTQANSGGRTWDFGMIPYEPMPQQWQKRYDELCKCNEKYGLQGIMECHHYGFTPSFITAIEKRSFEYFAEDKETVLRKVVSRFSNGKTKECIEALGYFSEAIRLYPANDEEQYCAMRVGSAYPLCLKEIVAPPEDPAQGALKHGLSICEYEYKAFDKGRYTLHSVRIRPEIEILKAMIALMEKGLKILKAIENPNAELTEIINYAEYIVTALITDIHVKKIFLIRTQLKMEGDRNKIEQLLSQAEEIGKAEIENAKNCIEIAQRDSVIGYEPSMGYAGDKPYIEWKIKQTQYMLDVEIPMYRESLRY